MGSGVSIHAPVKARPLCLFHLSGSYAGFNPRAREGATSDQRVLPITCHVSIHAPVKARPPNRRGYWLLGVSFNPRAREGATKCL